MEPDELAKLLKNRKAEHYGRMAVTKMRVERHRRERLEKASLKAAKSKGTGPSVAAVGPAGETTTNQSARTGQEPR